MYILSTLSRDWIGSVDARRFRVLVYGLVMYLLLDDAGNIHFHCLVIMNTIQNAKNVAFS